MVAVSPAEREPRANIGNTEQIATRMSAVYLMSPPS